ncbi:30S ribosomal protein S9 [Mycoplasmopsis anatis]|uniref:Small ribosomal subunit protein uS9 n=1 Tax=Mycoplasmopsis anatis TaxID=171279 RepID=A0A9Q3L7U3_9BACT|nr:30S ribosomal protein S9 [Mycoplasmopsis anatis]MBW0594968.1 30S ribosomal protein S9 [Mycoplasmopsis anatis]MBW0595707.1 30S ribosomal protein S9 [Mycoplasmopsis anatis]MBW0596188.1 30S ribosomal protein S9 [Mycoplasmopsis anatis]MBW0596866.1 30S ribosomal protein S9 [Mycoplasmopsis anatis]MBW0597622.1 30S ribosomal protein S9 [Mycoplasmopsis anatis]
MAKSLEYRGLGRRKSSVARVILRPGKGKFVINGREALEYLTSELYLKDASQPFVFTETTGQFDVSVKVAGGGLNGQAGAIRLGIARALLEASEDYRGKLKAAGMLTRDARAKERKKPGLRAARRARQFSKR